MFMQRVKTKSSIRADMGMAQYDAQEKLFDTAISCRECSDLGIVAVAYISIDEPDSPYIEYNRCSCGAYVHPKLVSFIRNQV